MGWFTSDNYITNQVEMNTTEMKILAGACVTMVVVIIAYLLLRLHSKYMKKGIKNVVQHEIQLNNVNGAWTLPNFVCDFYIAMDVICSTSSIFNLVAISIDRYIAVTQPIKYAKHKNSRRVCLTILLVWAISAAIGSPIVLGLNNTPDRVPDLCVFYNSDFIVYSSLSSFYIPCIIMVFLYWNIFKALRKRAKKQRAARKPHISEITAGGSLIENIAQTKVATETQLDGSTKSAGSCKVLPDEAPTNTASGSNEEDDDNAGSPDIDDCHVIVNDKSTEFMLATVVEEAGKYVCHIFRLFCDLKLSFCFPEARL
ncbi:dopamine D2-like receptor [Ochlerotatus camptorhynchus]|uniref:dopamine D2-like receptor n=1 Tax=Ochlerotatus camptorhynchus TaxID=644619 RepID=UPI0031E455E0